MIAAEIIALVALLFVGAAGLKAVWSWAKDKDERERVRAVRFEQMLQDLRDALASRDYRRLDDFMVTWVDLASKDVLEHVKRRRDELYVDSNP